MQRLRDGRRRIKSRFIQTAFLGFLAIVFTIGLTFATVELPYRIDQIIIDNLTTPNLDSDVDGASRLQTELFIDYYNLREIGYAAFAVMLLLLAIGFSTKKTGLAAAGALAFMLPVFAQFAGVMFFLAGLGVLNVLWLPLLDISYDLQRLGMVIHAPYGFLRWMLGAAGINAYWYVVYFFIGGGLLVFFFGTYAWLAARAGRKGVADLWIYRFSRHPQYAGWIMWSYGVYLLLLQAIYPKRSWGISGSLPWLLSTMFIIGVAMVEELRMLDRHGEQYGRYRVSAPFLFPMPRLLRRIFSLPLRLIFKKDLPTRIREVVTVLSIYTLILFSLSFLFYMDGSRRISLLLDPVESVSNELSLIAQKLDAETDRRARYRLADRLQSYGEPAVDHFIGLLDSRQLPVRYIAMQALTRLPGERAVVRIAELLGDPEPDVRWKAAEAIGAFGARTGPGEDAGTTAALPGRTFLKPSLAFTETPLLKLLDDPRGHVRLAAFHALAQIGSEKIIERAGAELESDSAWTRAGIIDALGTLGSDSAVELILSGIEDEDAYVRRRSIIALLMTGSGRGCDLLERARKDDDWEVRVYASEVAGRLCR